MDTENNTERADRLKFIVAIMMKEYTEAIAIGVSILNREPNDYHVRKCLSALRIIEKSDTAAEIEESSLPNDEAIVSASGTEESDEASSSTDGTDDETFDKVVETAAVISVAEKASQSQNTKSISDCVREATSASTGTADRKLFTFREKMYRVLPLKFVRKK